MLRLVPVAECYEVRYDGSLTAPAVVGMIGVRLENEEGRLRKKLVSVVRRSLGSSLDFLQTSHLLKVQLFPAGTLISWQAFLLIP